MDPCGAGDELVTDPVAISIAGDSASFAFTPPTVAERWQFDLTVVTADRLEGELTIEDLGTGSLRRREALLVRR